MAHNSAFPAAARTTAAATCVYDSSNAAPYPRRRAPNAVLCVRVVVRIRVDMSHTFSVLQCVAVYCSVLQCVAVCCSVLQCVAAACHTHLVQLCKCVVVTCVCVVDMVQHIVCVHALYV